jgi:hypothetical protein
MLSEFNQPKLVGIIIRTTLDMNVVVFQRTLIIDNPIAAEKYAKRLFYITCTADITQTD